MEEFYDVFISYRRSDGLTVADDIFAFLKKKGLHVFLDREEMITGKYFDEQIKEHVINSPFYIFVATSDAFNFRTDETDYVAEEMRLAVEEYEKHKESRIMLPVFQGGVKLPKENEFPDGTLCVVKSDGINLRGSRPGDDELCRILEAISEVSRANLWYAGKRWYENSRKPGSRFSSLRIDERLFPSAEVGQPADRTDLPITVCEKHENKNGTEERKESGLIEAVSKSEKHSYLIGQGGIGKTTALFSLMKEAYDGKHYEENVQIPLFVELSRAPDTEGALYNGGKSTFIRREVYRQIRSDKKVKQFSNADVGKIDEEFMMDPDVAVVPVTNLLTKETNSPEYLLLLDGLNEVSRVEIEEEGGRAVVSMIIGEIEWLIDNCPNVQIILTSRSYETTVKNDSVKKLYLMGVDKNTILSYLEKSRKDAAALKSVSESKNLMETLSIPLFLTMFARIENSGDINTQGEIFRQFFNEKREKISDYTLQSRIDEIDENVRDAASETQKKRISAAAQHFILDFVLPELAFYMESREEFYIKKPTEITRIISSVLYGREDTDICGEYGSELFGKYKNYRKNTRKTADEFCRQYDNDEREIKEVVLECCIYSMGILQKNEYGISFVHHHLRDYFAAMRNINYVRMAVYLNELDEKELALDCLGYMRDDPLSPNVCRFIGEALHEFSNRPTTDSDGIKHYSVPDEPCDRNLLKRLLDLFRGRFDGSDGYCVYNLINSISVGRRKQLCGEDLSELDLRHCSLNGIHLGDCGRGADLSGALINDYIVLPAGHSGDVSSAEFSPDGRRIVTASLDETVKIWDSRTYELIATLEGHTAGVLDAAFSPDGKYIVSASIDKTARIWNAETYESVAILVDHTEYVHSVVYSPDGRYIASASQDGTVRIWDSRTYNLVVTLEWNKVNEFGWVYSPDDKTYYPEYHCSVVYSPDGKYIAVAANEGVIRIWNSATYEYVKIIEAHIRAVNKVVYSPDGKHFAGALDNAVRIWDSRTYELVKTIEGSSRGVTGATFSPDGKYIAGASYDKTIRIHDARTYEIIATLEGHNDWVTNVAYSPDGKNIISESIDDTVRIWDAVTYEQTAILEGIRHAVYSPDGRCIVSVPSNGNNIIQVRDAVTYEIVKIIEGEIDNFDKAFYSPDGKYIVSLSEITKIKIWDAISCKLVNKFEIGSCISSMAFSSDGHFFLFSSIEHTSIEVLSAFALSFLPVAELVGHTGYISHIAFSPDGKYIVSASQDRTVRIWNGRTYEPVAVLDEHTGEANSAVFSPDGKYIISASEDGTEKIWDAEIFECIETIPSVPGLFVQECDMTNLHPNSDISPKNRKILKLYGAKVEEDS